MSANKETLGKTLGVVLAVCLVCSVIVAGSAVGLRSKQAANAKLDMQTNILEAAGLLKQAKKAHDITGTYAKYIEQRYVDLSTGKFVDQPYKGYDMYKAALKPDQSIRPKPDTAGIIHRAKIASVYLLKSPDGKLKRIILPINGSGLWDMMYGLLAVDADGNTVRQLVYYEQKETPGLGGEVQNPKWKAKWDGKKLFKNGNVAIQVKKNAVEGNPYQVDALSGATLTSRGVQHTLNYWLGDDGYGPFLKKLREAS